MTGWLCTFLIVAAVTGAAAALQWRVAARWYGHVGIGTLALVLLRPVVSVTGDMSAILPDVWSDDAAGKDQIILVSVVTTLAVAVIAASLLTRLGQCAASLLRQPRQGSQ